MLRSKNTTSVHHNCIWTSRRTRCLLGCKAALRALWRMCMCGVSVWKSLCVRVFVFVVCEWSVLGPGKRADWHFQHNQQTRWWSHGAAIDEDTTSGLFPIESPAKQNPFSLPRTREILLRFFGTTDLTVEGITHQGSRVRRLREVGVRVVVACGFIPLQSVHSSSSCL